MPPPGEYRYLRAHPWLDAAVAARRPKAASPSIIPAQPAPAATQGPATATATAGTP